MKLFAFFYYVTVVFSAIALVYPVGVYFHLEDFFGIRYAFLVDEILLGLTLTGPIVLLRRLGTALWVRLLFLPLCLAAWFVAGLSIVEVFDAAAVEKVDPRIVGILYVGGCGLFVVGCFFVRARMVRTGFRVQALALAAAVGVIFWAATRPTPWEGSIESTIRLLAVCGPVALCVVPLAAMYYRYWKRGGEEQQIVDAVEALGV